MARIIRNPADRTQVALAAAGPLVLLSAFFASGSIVFEIALWLAVWLFLCRHNYILHNHVHYPFTGSKSLNRSIGVMLSLCTGMTVGNWKITHVHGHHVEHKIGRRADRRYVDYFRIDEAEQYSTAAAILHAVKTAPLQWAIPTYIMILGSIKGSRFRRVFYRYYLFEFLLVYGIVGICAWLNPAKALFYFGLLYSLVYLISRYICYLTHASSHGSSEHSIANVCLDAMYNRLFWNFGFHVAHHANPAAHWTTLPLLYRRLGVDQEPAPVAIVTNLLGFLIPPVFEWHRVKDKERC